MVKQMFSRLTALFCVVSLVLALLPLPAAAEGDATDSPSPLVTVDEVTVSQGQSCTVYVRAENLVELLGVSLAVEYDASALTLIDSGVLNMQGGVNTSEAGRAQMTAMAEGSISGNLPLMYLTFRASSTAELGTYPLTLSILQAFNSALTEIKLDKSSGSVTIEQAEIPTASFHLQGASTVSAGEQFSLQLCSNELQNMAAGQFSFSYDSTLLRFESISLLSEMDVKDATLSVNAQNEGLAVAAYAAAVAANPGALMEITFTALDTVSGTTTVTCHPASLYSADRTVIRADSVSHTLTVYKAESQPEMPVFCLEGDDLLPSNDTVTLNAVLKNGSSLAAADFVIRYNSSQIKCIAATAMSDTDPDSGSAVRVFVNPTFDEGTVSFSLLAPGGITEDLVLLTVEFEAVARPTRETTLTLEATDPVDSTASPIDLCCESKSITISSAVYTVTFLDHDGTILETQKVAKSSAATAPEVNGKAPSETEHYTHTGWDKKFSSVTSDLTVTAVYEGVAHDFSSSAWQQLDEESHVRTCSGCTITQTAAHTWDDGVETKAPGCVTTGTKIFTCSACSTTSTEVIDALGHSYETPDFQWADDLSACTASFACNICAEGTENKTLSVPCNISSETSETACTSTITYTATVVLGEEAYTDQKQQSSLLKPHTWGTWSSDGIESHTHTCIDCGASASEGHHWQENSCADCGQTDAYYLVNGNTVTVYAANLPEGAQMLAAGYTSGGQMIVCALAQRSSSVFETLELTKTSDTSEIRIFILDADWCPIRAHIIG